MDWCRDIDYGSLPQYLALLLAAIVGVLTYMSVLTGRESLATAQETARRDVEMREYAQARLVYSDLVETLDMLTVGNTSLVNIKDPNAPVVQFNLIGEELPVKIEQKYSGTTYSLTANVPARLYVVRVSNNSDELISAVVTSVQGQSGNFISGSVRDGRLIAPHSISETVFAVEADYKIDFPKVVIEFTDSVGVDWRRDGAGPVRRATTDGV